MSDWIHLSASRANIAFESKWDITIDRKPYCRLGNVGVHDYLILAPTSLSHRLCRTKINMLLRWYLSRKNDRFQWASRSIHCTIWWNTKSSEHSGRLGGYETRSYRMLHRLFSKNSISCFGNSGSWSKGCRFRRLINLWPVWKSGFWTPYSSLPHTKDNLPLLVARDRRKR